MAEWELDLHGAREWRILGRIAFPLLQVVALVGWGDYFPYREFPGGCGFGFRPYEWYSILVPGVAQAALLLAWASLSNGLRVVRFAAVTVAWIGLLVHTRWNLRAGYVHVGPGLDPNDFMRQMAVNHPVLQIGCWATLVPAVGGLLGFRWQRVSIGDAPDYSEAHHWSLRQMFYWMGIAAVTAAIVSLFQHSPFHWFYHAQGWFVVVSLAMFLPAKIHPAEIMVGLIAIGLLLVAPFLFPQASHGRFSFSDQQTTSVWIAAWSIASAISLRGMGYRIDWIPIRTPPAPPG